MNKAETPQKFGVVLAEVYSGSSEWGYSCKVLDLMMQMTAVDSGSPRAGKSVAPRETLEV